MVDGEKRVHSGYAFLISNDLEMFVPLLASIIGYLAAGLIMGPDAVVTSTCNRRGDAIQSDHAVVVGPDREPSLIGYSYIAVARDRHDPIRSLYPDPCAHGPRRRSAYAAATTAAAIRISGVITYLAA